MISRGPRPVKADLPQRGASGGGRLAAGEDLLLADQARDVVLKTKPAEEEAKR